ncbi:hypothetical protein ACFPOU_09230 [Massilia jejuensis]|uniref:Uncharacterized protein n=1 Tax=Massilia jejuensis TaxID=648894 RepID=A0ABW0PF81_9BURK
MSSVEIVEVINAMRGPGKAEMRHDNFIAKLEAHPGITHLNFQGSYSVNRPGFRGGRLV